MTITSSTTSNPINIITKMDNINQYKHEIAIAPTSVKRRKYMAKYNLIKEIEGMDITLNEKIILSGMSSRKYQISRRILNRYPTVEEFSNALDNEDKASFEEFTYNKDKQKADVDKVYNKIEQLFVRHSMPSGSTERNQVVTKLATNNDIQMFIDDDNYFSYGDCLVCGEAIHIGDGIIKHLNIKGVNIPYPCCSHCIDEKPDIEEVLLSQHRYNNVMRQAYEEILSMVR